MYYTVAATAPPPLFHRSGFSFFVTDDHVFRPSPPSFVCSSLPLPELQTVGAARRDIECSVVARLSNLIKTTAVRDLADFTYLY